MAVYKPTLCYPFTNGLDIRTGINKYSDNTGSATPVDPAKYITCKVETSNVPVIGYSVALFSSKHKQIFPVEQPSNGPYVSPIYELQVATLGYDANIARGTNSGANGSTLQIPFFRSNASNADSYAWYGYRRSCNAIYYQGDFVVHHIILDESLADEVDDFFAFDTTSFAEDIANWQWYPDDSNISKCLVCRDDNNILVPPAQLKIDGEYAICGDLVAVLCHGGAATQSNYGGIFQVVERVIDGQTVFALSRKASLTPDQIVTVWQGNQLHDTNWILKNGIVHPHILGDGDSMWKDIFDHSIAISSTGETYQWEVTLYQGAQKNGDPIQVVPTAYGAYLDLVNTPVASKWYDNTITGGQIMGTTTERLQISDDQEKYLPQGTDTDPLILQDTYCTILSSTTSNSGYTAWGRLSQFSVHDYDATYGHVYPSNQSVLNLPADRMGSCVFYQHSHNPDEIEDTDIVDYVIEENIEFEYWHIENGEWEPDLNGYQDWINNNISVTNRYLVSPYLSPVQTPGAAQILLTSQTVARENGVWQWESVTAQISGDSYTKNCLRRAASYDSWANFIGKVIYAAQPAGQNYISLVGPGGVTLWDPHSVTGQYGEGQLYFDIERPILLFRNKLYRSGDFTGVVRSVDNVASYIAGTMQFGAAQWQVGDFVADRAHKLWYISAVQPVGSTKKYTIEAAGEIPEGGYVYISGEVCDGNWNYKMAGTVMQAVPNGWQQSWDLHRGKLLFNTSNTTYISPWSPGVITYRMGMQLLSPGVAFTTAGATNFLKIEAWNEVTHSINHEQLTTYIPSDSQSDAAIPYRYDINSFFRTSDSNPFICYEAPYLRLAHSGAALGGLYDVSSPVSNNIGVYTRYLQDNDILSTRHMDISAEYVQFNQSAWESYQWQLLAEPDQVILQDSGQRYDGLIQSDFYGLANELNNEKKYIAKVIVTNSYGDVLEYQLTFSVSASSMPSFLEDTQWFKVTFDCTTQSNIIEFQWGQDSTAPSLSYSIYRREYEVYQKPGEYVDAYAKKELGAIVDFYADAAKTILLPRAANIMYRNIDNSDLAEYNLIYHYDPDGGDFVLADPTYQEFKGEWEPVIVSYPRSKYKETFRDFNIVNGKTYQYIVYPADIGDGAGQTFANYFGDIWEPVMNGDESYSNSGHLIPGDTGTATRNGTPVTALGDCWSMVELVPEVLDNIDIPAIRKKYRADKDNVWLFNLNVDTGDQEQNISRNEFETLGQYPKFGYGKTNYVSGSVRAYLGSELVCSENYKYIERTPKSRITPMSSNEKALMLEKWRAFVYSGNPKLLKDIKGQSWVVQILSASNTPANYFFHTPDTISFQWKQIDSPRGALIYSEYDTVDQQIQKSRGAQPWTKIFGGANLITQDTVIPYQIQFDTIEWTFGGNTAPYGTKAKIKVNSAPSNENDYTYLIDGSAEAGAHYGNRGTWVNADGDPVDLPCELQASTLFIWVADSDFPLGIGGDLNRTIQNVGYSHAAKIILKDNLNLFFEATHGAQPLSIILNNLSYGTPVVYNYVPAEYVYDGQMLLYMGFKPDSGFIVPPQGDTTHVTVSGAGYSWSRLTDEYGMLSLGAATGDQVVVNITAIARPQAPQQLQRTSDGERIVWSPVASAGAYYKVYVDGQLETTTPNTFITLKSLSVTTSGIHAITVQSVVDGVTSIDSSPYNIQAYQIIDQTSSDNLPYVQIDTVASDAVLWDGLDADVYYDFTNASCPWRLKSGSESTVTGCYNYDITPLTASRGRITVSNPWVGAVNIVIRMFYGSASLPLAPEVTQESPTLRWVSQGEVDHYYIVPVSPSPGWLYGERQVAGMIGDSIVWSYKNFGSLGANSFTVVACGTAATNFSTAWSTPCIDTRYDLVAVLDSNVVPDPTNDQYVWAKTMTNSFIYNFVNGYTVPISDPAVTGVSGDTYTWDRPTSTQMVLYISAPIANVSFTLTGTPPAVQKGDVVQFNADGNTPAQFRVLNVNGTVAEVVSLDTLSNTCEYNNDSSAGAYSGGSVDSACLLYYSTLAPSVQAAIASAEFSIDKWDYTASSAAPVPGSYTGYSPMTGFYGLTRSQSSIEGPLTKQIYILGFQDIVNYFDTTYIDGEQLNTMLWGRANTINYNGTPKEIYLRSHTDYSPGGGVLKGAATVIQSPITENPRMFSGVSESIVTAPKYVKPAFRIDLSSIDYMIISE